MKTPQARMQKSATPNVKHTVKAKAKAKTKAITKSKFTSKCLVKTSLSLCIATACYNKSGQPSFVE